MTLPALPTVETIGERLRVIFPEGTPNRGYCTREIAARTIYVMLYIGAVEGADRWLAPSHVYRMTVEQAREQSDQARAEYGVRAGQRTYSPAGQRWYADNTREPIRDETLKEGFGQLGAIVLRPGIPTTSNRPRYALAQGFAALFDPTIGDSEIESRIAEWQRQHLSASALARIQIIRRGAATAPEKVLVTFPNGETRRMEAGPSSIISKAFIEQFATRFLENPAVVWLSESGNKVVVRDDQLAQSIGLMINPDRVLPDIIVVDLGNGTTDPLLVFAEVVASDGPMSEGRKNALLEMALKAGFRQDQTAFVTAYMDRDTPAFKRTVPALAWHSFAWFASEPEHILILHQGSDSVPLRLATLLSQADTG